MKSEEDLKLYRISRSNYSISHSEKSISHVIEYGVYFSIFSNDCVSPISFTGVGNGFFSDITGFNFKTCIFQENNNSSLFSDLEIKLSFKKEEIQNIAKVSCLEKVEKQYFNEYLLQEKHKQISFFDEINNRVSTNKEVVDSMQKEYEKYVFDIYGMFLSGEDFGYKDMIDGIDYFDFLQTKRFIENHDLYTKKIKLQYDLNNQLEFKDIKNKITKI